MASRPGSDELAFISLDSNIDVYGMRWTGSTWDAMGASAVWDDAAAIATEKCIDVAFEKTSGDIMFVWGDATSTDNYYRTYSASTLSANTLLDQSTAGGVANWIRLASDPTAGSDQIMVGILDGGSDLNTAMWSGTGWGSFTEHSAGVENHVNLVFDIIFETHSSNANDAWLVWGNGSAVSRRLWNGSGTPAWQTATTSGDDTGYIRLNAHPNSGAVFALLEEDVSSANDDITTLQLTGGSQTWSSVSTVWVGPVPRALSLSKIDIASERFVAPIFNRALIVFSIILIQPMLVRLWRSKT